jgi:hypothetical protein
MTPPLWLSPGFAGVMLLIAVYCAGRLIAARAWRRGSELDADGVHLVMGVAMAGMLAPRLSVVPVSVQEVVFALAAAWFAGQAIRVRRGAAGGRWHCLHPVPHVCECLAMVYMLAVPASGNTTAAMAGMGGGAPGMVGFPGSPAIAVLLALFMVGYAAWLSDRLVFLSRLTAGSSAAPRAGRGWPALAPRAAVCYKIAMAVTMAYMLIMMV